MRILTVMLWRRCAAAPASAKDAAPTYGADPADLAGQLDRLAQAYPETIAGIDGKDLLLKDGTRLPISDGRSDKSFEELLNKPDIGDMFAFAYPAGAPAAAPALNVDPGRIRVEALFRALYGDCQKGTLANTRKVAWVPKHGGGSVTFTTAQGADKALEAVSAELDQLPKSFTKFLVPSAGTYNCRAIADDRPHVDARLCGGDRHQHQADDVLAMGEAGRRRALPLVEQDPAGDHRRLREARLHLGRPLVSLRHHAFRIPAGAVAARQNEKAGARAPAFS